MEASCPSKLQRIRIVFERSNTWLGAIIRWLTRSKLNHVAVEYYSTDWQEDWAIEAELRGVWTRPSYQRKWLHEFEVLYDVSEDMRKAQRFIGDNYDFKGIFVFGWLLLFWRLFKVRLRRPWASSKGQLCSELVSRMILPQTGSMIANPQWTTPQELYNICCLRRDLFRRIA